jgi:sensor histidine kinase YesM
METSQLYLDIEKVRFSERLKLVFEIEDTVRDSLVPTMVLQPLIENSIKHGISKNQEGGTLTIKAYKDQDSLILQVIDNGPGISGIDGKTSNEFVASGVGINNIRNRLEQLYDNNYELSFSNVSPRGLSVTMRIPNED